MLTKKLVEVTLRRIASLEYARYASYANNYPDAAHDYFMEIRGIESLFEAIANEDVFMGAFTNEHYVESYIELGDGYKRYSAVFSTDEL